MRSILALALALGGCADLETNPSTISFGGRTYDVRFDDHGPCLAANGLTVRCFGRGTLIAFDFSGDGRDDVGIYSDERDGFRHTFAYLELLRNDGTPLADAVVEEAKWKEGHWAWIDPADWPGLRAPELARFMREQDDAHR